MPLRMLRNQVLHSFDHFLSAFLSSLLVETIKISWVHTVLPTEGTVHPHLHMEMTRHDSCLSVKLPKGLIQEVIHTQNDTANQTWEKCYLWVLWDKEEEVIIKPGNTILKLKNCLWGFPCSSVGKESACNAGDPGPIPGSGRFPGEGNGNPLQYSCLENPMDRGAWQATIHGVARVGHNLPTKPPPPSCLWDGPLTHVTLLKKEVKGNSHPHLLQNLLRQMSVQTNPQDCQVLVSSFSHVRQCAMQNKIFLQLTPGIMSNPFHSAQSIPHIQQEM